jgi:hypothetical protein
MQKTVDPQEDLYFYKAGRDSYSYPPGRLIRSQESGSIKLTESLYVSALFPTKIQWQKQRSNFSSKELDQYHNSLLLSNNIEDVVLGVCSVQFWGYLSGKNGAMSEGRALARTHWFLNGREGEQGNSATEIYNKVVSARKFIHLLKIKEALRELMSLRYLGMSFASKVLAFISPEKCAVYDSLIAELLKNSAAPIHREMYIRPHLPEAKSSEIYEKWCAYCSDLANYMNSHPLYYWTDWSGVNNPWRAVDIERSLFHYSMDQKPRTK